MGQPIFGVLQDYDATIQIMIPLSARNSSSASLCLAIQPPKLLSTPLKAYFATRLPLWSCFCLFAQIGVSMPLDLGSLWPCLALHKRVRLKRVMDFWSPIGDPTFGNRVPKGHRLMTDEQFGSPHTDSYPFNVTLLF